MPKSKRGFDNPSPDKLYGGPITINIDGEEWKMDRIKIKDISAVYARIRDNRINAIVRNSSGLPPHLVAEALAHTAAIDPTQDDYWEYANTPAGLVYIMFRCLQPHKKALTEDEVMRLIEKEGGLKDVLFAESGITEPEKPKKPDAEGENSDPLLVFGPRQKKTGPKEQDG